MCENIKEDAFFYPVIRKGYCFQDFSQDIANNIINIPEKVVCCVGIGYIFKWTKAELTVQLQQLMETIFRQNTNTHLWFSTLLPIPARMHKVSDPIWKFNSNLITIVEGLGKMGCKVSCLRSHTQFMEDGIKLDENTGILTEKYNVYPQAESMFGERGIRLHGVGWFHLRELWMRQLGIIPQFPKEWRMDEVDCIDDHTVEESKHPIEECQSSDEEDNLLQNPPVWNSPKTLLDMTRESVDMEEN